jgi:hypothetical protein
MAKALQGATKDACTIYLMKSPKLPKNLLDALRADLEPELLELREKAYGMYANTDDTMTADRRLAQLKHTWAKLAREHAIALFDETFPVMTLDAAMLRVLGVRQKLVSRLNALVAKARPLDEANIEGVRAKKGNRI